MKNKVRVGVVGTSGYSDLMYLSTIKGHAQAELAAICGRNLERNAEMAAKYGVPQVYSDYLTMIESGGLDAVVVATPDDLHYPITMAALEAGLHVLCEKPLAINARQALEMLDTAEARGLLHMVMFEWRCMPEFRQVIEMISRGDLGRIHNFSARWLMGFARSSEYLWRNDASNGNGVLGDVGAHLFDLARVMVGEITGVSAHLACHYQRARADRQPFEPANDSAMLLLEFADGAHGTLEVSYVTHVPKLGIEHFVAGTAGTLRSSFLAKDEGIWLARNDDEDFQPVTVEERFMEGGDPAVSMFDRFVELTKTKSIGPRRFIDAILGKEKVETTFYDGWKAQLVIDAALESHRTGKFVKVEAK